MNHFSQQLNMSHISQCKPLGTYKYLGGPYTKLPLRQGGATRKP